MVSWISTSHITQKKIKVTWTVQHANMKFDIKESVLLVNINQPFGEITKPKCNFVPCIADQLQCERKCNISTSSAKQPLWVQIYSEKRTLSIIVDRRRKRFLLRIFPWGFVDLWKTRQWQNNCTVFCLPPEDKHTRNGIKCINNYNQICSICCCLNIQDLKLHDPQEVEEIT